uniref:Uncharacterized protein n=1 Tax=Arundo donax TaxID=35708 RepID=A0A0A9HZR0_ARUDO
MPTSSACSSPLPSRRNSSGPLSVVKEPSTEVGTASGGDGKP